MSNNKDQLLKTCALALAAFPILVACGGGGGGSSTPPVSVSPPPPPPPPPPPTGWQAGVFEAASSYKDQCQNPRSGSDIEGNPFPDVAGTTEIENFWLRSWTNETYLWNDEVTDLDPGQYSDRVQYFNLLRTTEVTPSGEDKDDFHFSESTEDFLERRNAAPSAAYGFSLVAFSTSVPRDYRIRYTDPDTPASEVVSGVTQFNRGTRILEVDGVDLVNGGATQAEIDTLNAGLFPATAEETHTFLVQDEGDPNTRTVTIVSADLSTVPVNRTRIINTATGDVGYIMFNTFSSFSSEEAIATAISDMSTAGVSDLVLDLRYNGGGLLAVASQLSYMIAGTANTTGHIFEILRFNDDAGIANPVVGGTNDPVPFYTTGLGFSLSNGTPLETLNLNRVFILSTAGTCSASEAVINGLRGIDVEVILIGDTTCGKPYGFYPQDNCGETYYTIQFQGVNDKGFGDYADGFVPLNSSFNFGVKLPGCQVSDDYTTELGDESEALLATALAYRSTGTCPATSTKTMTTFVKTAQEPADLAIPAVDPRDPIGQILQNNRDMTPPPGASGG